MTRQNNPQPKKPSKRRGQKKLFSFLATLVLGGVSGGFIAFATYVDGLETPQDLPSADGIVVWTGPGGGRLEMAGQLMERGLGERLLVSGVNPSLSETRVANLAGLSELKTTCCLDVDYAALDTRGNARETASWADALGYEHIILVTSSYHMPRARIEIGHKMASLRITAVPVRHEARTRWWKDSARFRRVLGEYGKYLMVMARGRSETDLDRKPVLPEQGLSSQSNPVTESAN